MRTYACRLSLALVVTALLLSATGRADVVELRDGSRLLGTVKRMGDSKLLLETQFAGELEIDSALVVKIEVDEKVNVDMDTGDRLVGSIEWREELDRALVHTELGDLPVSVERITAIWPEGGQSPEVLAMEEQIAKVRAEAEKARAKWGLTAEIGLLYKEGNTKQFTARGGIELRRKSLKDLLRLYVRGDYNENDRVRDTAEVIGGAYYEYLFTERLFGYGRADLEYDEFEDIELRFSSALGVGYYWIKKEEQELKTRGGVGFLHESYISGGSRNTAQAELALDYRLDIAPWLRFTHGTEYYPTFESFRDYRLVSDTAFTIPIASSEVWKIKLGAMYEYKSIPQGGAERLDQTYYANLVLDIE